MNKVSSDMLRIGQLEMLNILNEIDRICRKYQIDYWLEFETLLGAIRHEGFIPWDDDCDIGMMRSDFNRFKDVISKELSTEFFFQTKETDPKYWRKMAKIRSNKIKMVEHDESLNESYHQGVYIDIFIYDFYPKWALSVASIINTCQNIRKLRKKFPKKSLSRNLVNLACLPVTIFYYFFKYLVGFLFRRTQSEPSDYVGSGMDQSGAFYLTESSNIFPICRQAKFENKYFYIPNKSEQILNNLYGDYLVLPKVEDRINHSKCICFF